MDGRGTNMWGAVAVGVGDLVQSVLVEASRIDLTAVSALLVIRARPGRSTTDLAAALAITHSGAVRTVERLMRRGLVRKQAGTDGRSNGLVLSADGGVLAERALDARREALAALTTDLPKRQADAVTAALTSVLSKLPDSQHDAWRICRTCEHDVCRGAACPVGSAISRGPV